MVSRVRRNVSETVSAGVWDFLNDAVKFLNRIHTYLRLHRSQGVLLSVWSSLRFQHENKKFEHLHRTMFYFILLFVPFYIASLCVSFIFKHCISACINMCPAECSIVFRQDFYTTQHCWVTPFEIRRCWKLLDECRAQVNGDRALW